MPPCTQFEKWQEARKTSLPLRGHALLTCHLFMCPGPTLETSSILVTLAQLTLPDLDPLKSSLFLNANRRNRLSILAKCLIPIKVLLADPVRMLVLQTTNWGLDWLSNLLRNKYEVAKARIWTYGSPASEFVSLTQGIPLN